MRTHLLILVLLAVTAGWAWTQHPLLFVAVIVTAVVMVWSCDRDNKRDGLAPYRYPGGDQ
jgi:hypothetical protein